MVLPGDARHLYEDVYCIRGQAENLIKMGEVVPAYGLSISERLADDVFEVRVHTGMRTRSGAKEKAHAKAKPSCGQPSTFP